MSSWLTAAPIAHRGLQDAASGVVENSAAAARAAIAGRYAIECDVQRTADGDAVVFHDFVLDRLTASGGEVAARSSQDLQAIGYSRGQDRIMSFESLLALVAGQVPLI